MTGHCLISFRVLLRVVLLPPLMVLVMLVMAFAFAAAVRAQELVVACGVADAGGANNIFTPYETFGITAVNNCNQANGLYLSQDSINRVAPGGASGWIATAPAGLAIVGANVSPFDAYGVDGTYGYVMHFYWTGAPPQQVIKGGSFSVPVGGMSSAQFGFDLQCSGGTPCSAFTPPPRISVYDVQLTVSEVWGPTLAFNSGSLWYEGSVGHPSGTRWVYGTWPLGFSASSPSGIESMSASMAGETIAGPPQPGCWPAGSAPARPNTIWQQCDNGLNWTPRVTLSGVGNQTLHLSATSSAQNSSDPAGIETIHVDTQVPTVGFSGPTSASSAAGTQYITATGTAGPSGVQGLSCSLDNAPAQWYAGSTKQIPVSGIGVHSLACRAENNSYNAYGQADWSLPATWSLDIGQPTVSGISFSKIVDKLRCRSVRERVKAPARWVAVHRHGKLVRVRRRAHRKLVKVVRCHPRTVKRQVTVLVKEKRHGRSVLVKRKKVERVVMLPHLLSKGTERVAHGRGTTVSGWLGTSSGIALPGRAVDVTTAPNNGLGRWTQARVVMTAANGQWSVHLPPGPSRLVEATYAGDSTTLPSSSATIHLVVPAKVKLHISPRSTRWGGKITITGRVLGGHIPGGKLLRLRIGVEGVRGTVGIPDIRRNGRFRTTWTFSAGSGVVHYWFSVSTLNEADYPFAPASSRRVYVKVGPG